MLMFPVTLKLILTLMFYIAWPRLSAPNGLLIVVMPVSLVIVLSIVIGGSTRYIEFII